MTDPLDEEPPAILTADPFWRSALQKLRRHATVLTQRSREAEQARAKAEIRSHRMGERLDQLSEIVRGFSEPVVAIDQYDELVFANEAAAELFGFPHQADSIEARLLKETIKCRDLVRLLTETRRRKAPSQKNDELQIAGDETSCWYQVDVRPIPCDGATSGDDGPRHGAVAVLHEVSDHKETQKRHAEFVSAVSHEMKTPLAGIKAYVELLADGEAEDEETREEFLSVINGQADRLQRLIDNLLNLARIEAGVVQVEQRAAVRSTRFSTRRTAWSSLPPNGRTSACRPN